MRRFVMLLMIVLASTVALAQETRTFSRIPQPRATPLPPGARAVSVPVSNDLVRAALERVVAAWNTPELRDYLGETFPDRTRLADTLLATAPRDARLRLLAIQGMQVLTQFAQPNRGAPDTLVTRVSVTARTQVEWNDPARGFQRLEGTNEFILLLSEAMR